MNMDVAVAVAGLLIAVAAVVLGAWLDLRPRARDGLRRRGR
jgi:MFS-type transporter involved in bile tolerance (Atg22 family)